MSEKVIVRLSSLEASSQIELGQVSKHCKEQLRTKADVLQIIDISLQGELTAAHIKQWRRAIASVVRRHKPRYLYIQDLRITRRAGDSVVLRLKQKKHHKRMLARTTKDYTGKRVRQWFQLRQTGFSALGRQAIKEAIDEFFVKLQADIVHGRLT